MTLATPRVHWPHTRVWLLVALLAAACTVLVVSQLNEQHGYAAAAKLVASSTFVVLAVVCGATLSRYGRGLLVGLCFAWLGDLFLIGTSERLFLAGLSSFLLCHIAYIGAFASFGLLNRWSLSAVVPMAASSLLTASWLTPHLPGHLVAPVYVYIVVISLMVPAAFGARGAGAAALIPIGAMLFYLSDLSVAMLRFTEPAFPSYVWGLPLYYAGQTALALSVSPRFNKI